MEKSYARKELAKILPIRERLILKFLSEVFPQKTVDWTDENPIYIGKLKQALELFRLYNLERNMSITEARKQKAFFIEDVIKLLLETGEYKIYKRKIEWVEI